MRHCGIVAVLAAALCAFGPAPARADVVVPFSLQAQFIYTQSGPNPVSEPYNATLLINTTTGVVVDFSPPFFGDGMGVSQGLANGSNNYTFTEYSLYVPSNIVLEFDTPSLIGYTGGALVDINHPDAAGNYSRISEVHVPLRVFVSGFFTPLAVPEPSSLAVLAASGLASVTWVWGFRLTRRRALSPDTV